MLSSCQYAIIENGIFTVSTTRNMKRFVKSTLGLFDYRDFLFEDDSSIYILVKDISFYDNDKTIIYRSSPNDSDSYFNGKVIFTKMNEYGFVSLSNDDIDLIKRHIHKLSTGLFEMSYFSNRFDQFWYDKIPI